jgi:hypothetical protein
LSRQVLVETDNLAGILIEISFLSFTVAFFS